MPPNNTKKEEVNKRKPIKLMAYHFEAVELRYLGQTYGAIAAELQKKYGKDFRDDRVRRWFARDGILEAMYNDYSAKENERRRKLMLAELQKLYPKIPAKFQALLDRVKRHPFTGKELIDEKTNKPIEQVDQTTLKTLVALANLLGFKVTALPEDEDPVDRYFDRAEGELPPHAQPGTSS